MRTFIFALLLLMSPLSRAAEPFSLPIYAAGFLDRQGISLSGEKFEPLVAGVAIGAWIYEGIGIELELGSSVIDDNVGSLSLEPESQWSFGLRLESAPVNRVSAYALISASGVAVASRFTTGSPLPDKRRFRGVRGVFGLTSPLQSGWVIDAAFLHAEYDDDFGVNGFRLGARYTLTDVKPRARRGWFE